MLSLLFAVVIHELSHALMTWGLGLKVLRCGVSRRGVYIVRESGAPWQNFLVSAAGPLGNLLTACVSHGPLRTYSVVLGLVNLIPMPGSDGMNMLKHARHATHGRTDIDTTSCAVVAGAPPDGVRLQSDPRA